LRRLLQTLSVKAIEAYDDGFFPASYKGGRGETLIAGVELDGDLQVNRIGFRSVRVDLNTSMEAIIDISKLFNGEVVLLDGVTYAGFDVVDPAEVASKTGKGVIVVFLYPLNLQKIKVALVKHFEDWSERYSVIERVYTNSIYFNTPWRPIRVYVEMLDRERAFNILRETCIYSPTPEPLRIAHKIASTFTHLLHL
jgi:endonuclease V-like protein UPF0215 family